MENSREAPYKLKIELPYDSAILLLGMYLDLETIIQKLVVGPQKLKRKESKQKIIISQRKTAREEKEEQRVNETAST